MTGTVIQDPRIEAEVLYKVGMNLIKNLSPTENTDYKVAEGEIIIPFHMIHIYVTLVNHK